MQRRSGRKQGTSLIANPALRYSKEAQVQPIQVQPIDESLPRERSVFWGRKMKQPTFNRVPTVTLLLLSILLPAQSKGQTNEIQNQQLSENVFKNVQVLRGLPVDEFMDTMGMFASS